MAVQGCVPTCTQVHVVVAHPLNVSHPLIQRNPRTGGSERVGPVVRMGDYTCNVPGIMMNDAILMYGVLYADTALP